MTWFKNKETGLEWDVDENLAGRLEKSNNYEKVTKDDPSADAAKSKGK